MAGIDRVVGHQASERLLQVGPLVPRHGRLQRGKASAKTVEKKIARRFVSQGERQRNTTKTHRELLRAQQLRGAQSAQMCGGQARAQGLRYEQRYVDRNVVADHHLGSMLAENAEKFDQYASQRPTAAGGGG